MFPKLSTKFSYSLWKTFIKRPSNIFSQKTYPSIEGRKVCTSPRPLKLLRKKKKCKDGRQKTVKRNLKTLPSCCKIRQSRVDRGTALFPLSLFAALSLHLILTLFYPLQPWAEYIWHRETNTGIRTGGIIFPVQCRPRTKMKCRIRGLRPFPRLPVKLST